MQPIKTELEARQALPSYTDSALNTIRLEIQALEAMERDLKGPAFSDALNRAVLAMAQTEGRVIVSGMGKSGHIGRKIAATLRSTGTPALFLHPGEASHGDLGLVTDKDVVLALTWSGETSELHDILHYCNRFGITLIVATSQPQSRAARAANICLLLPSVREACPNDLAPTTSTTLQLVLGDMLAVALIEARGFSPTDFQIYHPAGALGALLAPVEQVMGVGDAIPKVGPDAPLSAATVEMSQKRYGATAVVDEEDRLIGVFTDGDLRRCISLHDLNSPIGDHMSSNPVTVGPKALCSDTLRIMNNNAVSVIFVVEGDRLVGIAHMHDIVRGGVV